MQTKTAFVAILGRPNVGKSSLLNLLVGEKVAIVTAKPQTTRTRITGVRTFGAVQLVFTDTPGVHTPRTKLGGHMVRAARGSFTDADAVVFMTSPTGSVTPTERELLEALRGREIPVLLVLNKIDTLARKDEMMAKIGVLSEFFPFAEVVPVSVLRRDGTDLLLDLFMAYAVEGPHFYESDSYTDQTLQTMTAEIVREKLLIHLQEELPHGTAVGIDSMKQRGDGAVWDIHCTVYCEKQSHKGMIVGKNGGMLKLVGTEARRDIERLLDAKAALHLWVRVKDDWRNREGLIREFGFDATR